MFTRRLVNIVLLALAASAWSQTTTKPGSAFPVYDAVFFKHKPDLKQYGLKPIALINGSYMWEGNNVPHNMSLPDPTRVLALAQVSHELTDLAVIDIEHWPVTGDPGQVAQSVNNYRTVVQWFKDESHMKVGLYGTVPDRDYWRAIEGPSSPKYRQWQAENDRLAPIADGVDVFFPSLYTFYEDRAGWQKYAITQIKEARRYAGGKPVYVFLWPQYHVSNKDLIGQFLPADYWRMELETARKYADGAVLWCCAPSTPEWNPNAPWWKETLSFLHEVNPSPSGCSSVNAPPLGDDNLGPVEGSARGRITR